MNKLLAEGLGTAFLLIGVVGSGIMGDMLSGGNVALALLANSIATGCVLYVLITVLGPVSGAHFNPAVTLVFLFRGDIAAGLAGAFMICQIVGGILGVWASHLMFDLPVFQFSDTERSGPSQWWAEVIASFGLVFVILGGLRHRPEAVATLVALYITGAYWFTASTSFANPAVTIARAFTDTFAGIAPAHVAAFIAAQILGALGSFAVARVLFAKDAQS